MRGRLCPCIVINVLQPSLGDPNSLLVSTTFVSPSASLGHALPRRLTWCTLYVHDLLRPLYFLFLRRLLDLNALQLLVEKISPIFTPLLCDHLDAFFFEVATIFADLLLLLFTLFGGESDGFLLERGYAFFPYPSAPCTLRLCGLHCWLLRFPL